MIDIRKRRPLRPDSYPEWRQFLHPERTLAHVFGRLPEFDGGGKAPQTQEFRVRFGDEDINGHANYLSYIDWILEAVPPPTRNDRQIAEMEIHFLREASFGEGLFSRAQRIEERKLLPISESTQESSVGTEFLHSLVRKPDGAELARARTVWGPVTTNP